ncbi:AAA family ATPase [Flavobacterium granuli]|uniref:ATPase dynein-related AAA domain-containing protein n=1 Tax=Flavobacterium granuli TaxID=280093 RepID=A0ABU1RX57_9FLAO|nr:AAA family ATPase [Flavobacterium granuli]MDR6843344.1 hypothetical protein [Flavobacterium granuli]
MIKTLITRISILSQYNSENKTILWEDPTGSRWDNVYGRLVKNDNAIFISDDKLLIGIISEVNTGKSLLCTNIQEVNCQNDQLLRLHVSYPELISRVKANFQPFIHPLQLDLNQLIADAKNQKFISFYIFSGQQKYNELFQSLNENDRVVLLDNNNQFENVKLNSNQGLIDFSTELDVTISTEGLTIDEVIQKNKNHKRKSIKSNNVTRIEKIKTEISTNGFFKFTSFFTYHDTLFNKSVYQKKEKLLTKINTIKLNLNETVFKVSMSGKDINDESFTFFNDNNLIIVHSQTKAKGVSSQTQGDTFDKQMKIGDYFYMCRGNSNLEIIGRIISDATTCEYEDFGDDGWLQRSYEIVSEAIKEDPYTDDKKWWTPNDNSTCIAIPNKEIKDANSKIFIPFFHTQFETKVLEATTIKKTEIMSEKLNQILYGPPGTGKTYNTINRAIHIINPAFDLTQNRDLIKKEYDRLVKNGKIVFTTFHQNMSYEDFIEGIKPETTKDDNVIYKIHNGIFKLICIDNQIFKIGDKIGNYEIVDITNAEIYFKKPNGGVLLVSKNLINQLIDYVIKNNVENFESLSEIDRREYPFLEPYYINGYKNLYPKLIENIITKKAIKDETPKVLIIDEINRGNVSQIFGELITLIEEDKRLGKEEALEVLLPYSKEKFGVPAYLYIIGTMNTADRSVEALDAALRRRFCFEEMPPLYNLDGLQNDIFGYKAYEILKTINSRIEKLIDKDHAIGHSYLLNKDENSIVDSFYKNIIPLLQEYFFGDYGKLGLVLGKGFVHLKEWDKGTDAFADFDDDASNDFESRNVYEIIDYRKVKNHKIGSIEMTFEKAIKVLMKGNIE